MGFAAGRNWVYFGLEDFTGVTFAGIVSPLASNLSLGPFSVPVWVWVGLLSIGVAIAVLVLLFSRHKVKIKQGVRGYSTLSGESRGAMLNLYGKMAVLLVRKGMPCREPHQPPYEYATVICSQIRDGREIVEWLTKATVSAAYDPRPFHSATIGEARSKLSVLRQVLAGRG